MNKAVSHGALCPLALAEGNISKPVPNKIVSRNANASTAAGCVGSWFFTGKADTARYSSFVARNDRRKTDCCNRGKEGLCKSATAADRMYAFGYVFRECVEPI